MIRFLTIYTLLVLLPIWVWAQEDGEIEMIRAKAEHFLQDGQIDSALFYFELAGKEYRARGEFTSAFDAFFMAMKIRDTIPNSDLALSYLFLGSVEGMRGERDTARAYFNRAYEVAVERRDSTRICQALGNQGLEYREIEQQDTAIVILLEAERLAKIYGMHAFWFAHLRNNIANCYLDKGLTEQAITYFKEAYRSWREVGGDFDLALVLNNVGFAYYTIGQYDSSSYYFHEALRYANRADALSQKINVFGNLLGMYRELDQKDSVIKYLYALNESKEQQYLDQQNAAIEEMQMKYNYEKVARENAQQRSENAQQRIEIEEASNQRRLLLILLLSLLVLSLTGYLLYKQKANKREKQFAKINDLLKNQEIKSYQVVLDAQEEERKRIAGELHDRLGSTLSAAKLYFNNMEDLKNGQEAKAMKKGVELLDLAVQDVRNISHNMASGVLAQFGLEHALIDLRETISGSGRVKMKVLLHGLNKGMPREVQLQVYRMIQELVSNALKHSGANEIIVQVTRHESELTVTVEDNGSGFKDRGVSDGIGLKNMERRVELLNGTYHIDTGRDIGTIVSIDIPIDYDKTYTGG